MTVTYDALLGDTQTIEYTVSASNTNLYPDSNTIAITGPIWLPRIYGKDLTAFEIASSGKIAISLNDIHTVDITRSNYIDSSNFKNTIVSQSNYSMDLTANAGDLSISLDAYSNNLSLYAASNMSLTTLSGNMSFTVSNDTTFSTSNNLLAEANSNVSLHAVSGAATLSANNSNMYLYLNNVSNAATLYSSNNIYASACNSLNINAQSNVLVGALGGSFEAYADSSNMYLTLDRTTDDISMYAASNINLVSSNNTSVTSLGNIEIGALVGSFKTYADGSNMFLVMDNTTDNTTLYTSNDMFLSTSNTFNLNAQSNVFVGALGGDLKLYSQSSNMFLTMTSATNNVSLFASNNLVVGASNSFSTFVNSNISVSTIAGDYRLYVNSSNMFMRMSSTTNNINLFGSNNVTLGASNNFTVQAESNMTVSTSNGSITFSANSSNMFESFDSATNNITLFSSNDTYLGASNDYYINAASNIYVGALAGSYKVYADNSNMYTVMDNTTDNITTYAASNIYVSASNNYNLNAKSNVLVGALNGDLKLYSKSSNMFLVMDSTLNTINVFASNNMNVSVSNSYNNYVRSNLAFSTVAGDVKVYANSSNMYLFMDHTVNDTTLFTSNDLYLGASNNMRTDVNSNYSVATIAGSIGLSANSSNMFLDMDYATNDITLFSSNNTNVGVSNDLNISVNSNLNVSTTYGSYNLAVNSSNMTLTMDYVTNDTTFFTSNNYNIGVSNNMNVNVKSNLNIGALKGDVKIYSMGSNMYLTMDHVTNNVVFYASNNMNVSASNTYFLNAMSNVYVGALNGDFKAYAMGSNMFLTMDSSVNDVSLFSSNNTNVSVSNSFNLYVNSNISASANNGSVSLYANNSNMFVTMDKGSNNVAVYASNNLVITTSNSASLVTYSNVSVSASLGSLKLYSATSNMSLVMDAVTLDTTQYTSNNLAVSVSNDYSLNVNSNVYVSALAGDFKTYVDGSNMFLIMEKATDNTTLYTSNDMFLSASNTFNLNAQSNVFVGALGGSFKAYADSSNMYLTLDRTTDNISLYAASNITQVASNNFGITAKSNFTVGARVGDLKLYANSSNMFLTMDHVNNVETLYTLNQMYLTASNEFILNAQSNITMNAIVNNITMFASNNLDVTASNDMIFNAQSNVSINASKGDVGIYSMDSNMSLFMDHITNDVSLFSSNNTNVSVSNSFNLYVNSNISASANNGSVKVYANNSNMFVTMDRANNNTSVYTSNNLIVTASNSASLVTYSNVSVSASLGSLKLYSATSNMSLVMDAATLDTTQYTSNNMTVSVSNSYVLYANSNVYIDALAGDFAATAGNSNMYLLMENATYNTSIFTSNNFLVAASNDVNVSAASNLRLGAIVGSVEVTANNSNMKLTMDTATNNTTLYTSNNLFVIASNNTSITSKSNITVGGLAGSVKLYASGSNVSVVLDQPTSNLVVYASNEFNATACNAITLNAKSNVTINAVNNDFTATASNNFLVTASNDFVVNARSNVSTNASKGSWTAYANDSNMYLTMDQPTNTVSLYGLKDINVTASNDFSLNTQSNINANALNGSVVAYANSDMFLTADSSNMYVKMDSAGDVVSIYSFSNVALSASNVLSIDAMSNVVTTASNINFTAYRDLNIVASNNVTITASNQLILQFGSTNAGISIGTNSTMTGQSNLSFYVQAASNPSDPMMQIRPTDVLIRGDIVVTGSINTSNVFSTTVIQESLKVADTVLTLASVGSNFNPSDGPTDGVANTGAGIVIDGVPSGFDSNIPQAYDKTLKWNYGNSGIDGLGTAAGLSNESYWELKGGSFKMTHQKIVPAGGSNIVQNVSFGFRVNENDELEIVKTFWNTNTSSYSTKRIAKFGKIL